MNDSEHSDDSRNVALTGRGNIKLLRQGDIAVFSHLSYSYPLKLLSPPSSRSRTGIAYIITYGGGLVSGDNINVTIEIGSETTLLLLTQSSTKVFKERIQPTPASFPETDTLNPRYHNESVIQNLSVCIQKDALLLFLPNPVTCFNDASYDQLQRFKLEEGASLVVLDWITSGRMSVGEVWEFNKYHSINEFWVGGSRLARDVLLLENGTSTLSRAPKRLSKRMGKYSCYANVFLYGPLTQKTIEALQTEYDEISVYQISSSPPLVWSLSDNTKGMFVVRVAGLETEAVKIWLKERLKMLAHIVGYDVYEKAFL